jgi:O-antigen biosynthesis protein
MGSRARRVASETYRIAKGMRARSISATVAAERALRSPGAPMSYRDWLRRRAPRIDTSGSLGLRFSVVVGDGPQSLVARTASSALSQGAEVQVFLAGAAGEIDRDEITGEFVLVLRAGDALHPGALLALEHAHRVDPGLDLIVANSDAQSQKGRRDDPFFRPGWSPEALLGANYIDRAFAIRRSRLPHKVGAADSDVWQILLEPDFAARQVGEIPHVIIRSVRNRPSKPTAQDADMVRSVLEQRGAEAHVEAAGHTLRIRYRLTDAPRVSIVIPTRHSRANLDRLLPSLAKTRYDLFDVTIVDNGERTVENERWYEERLSGLDAHVEWWTESPFNYSRVNNVAVAQTEGEIVLLLNDDTEIVDSGWLAEIVGVLLRPGIGSVGVQHRRADNRIQHAGVVIGPGGFADNLFTGLEPDSWTMLGSTAWYRNSLAVTGACVAVRRSDWDAVGGLDERFELTGSDVVLGLDLTIRGMRSVVVPFDTVRHYESITRGSSVPRNDFFASYWRYHSWLAARDPYWSTNLSRLSAVPRLPAWDETTPLASTLATLGRPFSKMEQSMSISAEATALAATASVSRSAVRGLEEHHASIVGRREVRLINWYIPDIDMPFFGGLNTAFRMAAKMTRDAGVRNRFVVLAAPNQEFFRTALVAAFPELADVEIVHYDGSPESIEAIPPADASVATLWLTAAHLVKAPDQGRKFYLMQDYEPGFYPASSMYAMAEETYRLGLYGICNTESMHRIYTDSYGGKAMCFIPAVDRSIFHPVGRRKKAADEPVTIFAYARDHFRNCWELVYTALSEIKRRHGDRVRIVAAGARYLPDNVEFLNLGLMDYRATGALYRETDIGVTMQISRHPSYLPLELMASGVAMVAPDSTWFRWLFRDGVNSLLTMRSVDDLVERLESLIIDEDLRRKVAVGGLATIDESHSDWDAALESVYEYLCNPNTAQAPGVSRTDPRLP